MNSARQRGRSLNVSSPFLPDNNQQRFRKQQSCQIVSYCYFFIFFLKYVMGSRNPLSFGEFDDHTGSVNQFTYWPKLSANIDLPNAPAESGLIEPFETRCMSEGPLARFSREDIVAALREFYTPPTSGTLAVNTDVLVDLLNTLPTVSVQDHVDPILVQMGRYHPGISFNPSDYATIAFVDDAMTQVLWQTDLDFKVEVWVRKIAPFIAIVALTQGIAAIKQPHALLSLIDLLMRKCIGWSEDLGILGDQFMERVDSILWPFVNNKADLVFTHDSLQAFFGGETPTFDNMEQRLRDSALTVLASQKARYYAAKMLNGQMADKQLPMFIIFMLQGFWYELVQRIYTTCGPMSREWYNVGTLSDALVWSLQAPQQGTARHRSLMDTLPAQIKALCGNLPFDTSQVEACIADVEAEYLQIQAGTPSAHCDFRLLETNANDVGGERCLQPAMIERIEATEMGQWFLYDDPDEPEEKVARIKLILNWHNTERLLFTNRNRRKVLHMSYAQFSAHIDDGSVKLLTPGVDAHAIIASHLNTLVDSLRQQKKKEAHIDETTLRREESREYLANRRQAIIKALEEHTRHANEKRRRAMVLRQKAEQKFETATLAVKSLRVEAWMKLPLMEGTLTPCRLVAIIPATDKYIFVNRTGIKVAEYTRNQLSNMVVTENSEILDTGEEFASVLASVVTGLRQDRNKSYDELSGNYNL